MSNLGTYQTPWVRIQRLLNAQQQASQSLTDTMAGMIDLEARQRVSERPPTPPVSEWMPQRDEAAALQPQIPQEFGPVLPVPGDPTFEPGGTMPDPRRAQGWMDYQQTMGGWERWEENILPTPGAPQFEPGAAPSPEKRAAWETFYNIYKENRDIRLAGLERTNQRRAVDDLPPLTEEDADLAARQFAQRQLQMKGAVQRGWGTAFKALDYPRQMVKEHVIEPIVPEFAQEIPGEILEAALPPGAREIAGAVQAVGGPGVPDVTVTNEMVEEAASWVLDPWNLLPVVGWGPDLVRAANAAKRGAPAALKGLLKNPQVRGFLDDAIRAGERGGPRVPGVGPEDVARVEPELGGFPERFKGKARALEGGPPKEPPKAFRLAAGEEPPDWYSTVLRVTERFPESKKLYKGTTLARRAEMTKRTGDYMKLLDGELARGTPRQEAMENARRAFGGEMPDVEFAEAFMVTPEEVDRLAFRAIEYGKETGRVLEGDRALGAIAAMAERRVPRPHEISAIRRVYGNELADAIAKGSKDKDWWDTFMELWMFPKAVRSSFDISFPARQGIMVSARHPLMWSNSLKTAARAWVDPKWMMRETRKLLDDPTMIPVKMPDGSVQDMRLGDLFSDTGVIAETVEPFYKSDLAQKLVPGVRRSQVSFTGAGNKLRADMTRHWLNTWKRSGVEITPQRIERLGGLMNALTGRATIPRGWLFEMLQATWWSPQYRLSGPQTFLTATAGWALDPRVAGIATQNLVAFVGGGIGILSMLKASGLADVELDPRSSDFGKIRLGPTRINFWGSSQLLIRTIAQSITTTRIDPQLGPQTIDPGQPWARYWQSGASPQFSLITDYATGETYLGETLRPSEERGTTMEEVAQREFGTGGQRWMPLAWLDIKEAIEEDAVRGGLIGSLGMTGMGVQSYEPRAAQELQTIPEFKQLDVMQIQELKDFWNEVADFRKRLEEEEGMVVPPELAIRVWGESQERSPAFVEIAVDLRQGTSTRREARNPDYVRFIAEHADEIREDKPDLITQEIRLILHEMDKVQQAVAR